MARLVCSSKGVRCRTEQRGAAVQHDRATRLVHGKTADNTMWGSCNKAMDGRGGCATMRKLPHTCCRRLLLAGAATHLQLRELLRQRRHRCKDGSQVQRPGQPERAEGAARGGNGMAQPLREVQQQLGARQTLPQVHIHLLQVGGVGMCRWLRSGECQRRQGRRHREHPAAAAAEFPIANMARVSLAVRPAARLLASNSGRETAQLAPASSPAGQPPVAISRLHRYSWRQ